MNNQSSVDKYKYIWLPDDDLKVPVSQINSFLATARNYDLDLCQPSLSWNSYYSHHITLHNTKFLLRYTNFVELMMPLFRASLLKASLPLFEGRRFGSGLDYLWPRMMQRPLYRSAIIDAVQVQHLRPIGTGALYRSGVQSSDQEGETLFGRLQLKQNELPLVTYAGLSPRGRLISSKIDLASRLLLGWPSATKKKSRIGPRKRLRLAWSHSVPDPLLTEQFAEKIARTFCVSLA